MKGEKEMREKVGNQAQAGAGKTQRLGPETGVEEKGSPGSEHVYEEMQAVERIGEREDEDEESLIELC